MDALNGAGLIHHSKKEFWSGLKRSQEADIGKGEFARFLVDFSVFSEFFLNFFVFVFEIESLLEGN